MKANSNTSSLATVTLLRNCQSMVASSQCSRFGKLGGRVIARASLEDHAVGGEMNKKVQQLSTDNKMVSDNQQDVDPGKIIDLGTRIPMLRTPIASGVLTEAARSPEQWRIHEQQIVIAQAPPKRTWP